MRLLRFGAGLLVAALLAAWQMQLLPEFASAKPHTQSVPQVKAAAFAVKNDAPDPNTVFALVNKARAEQGLSALTRNDDLAKIAEARAADMAHNSYYAHKSPSGLYFYDLLKQSNINIDYACENLDLAFTTQPDRFVTDWLNSPNHRRCLLNADTTDAGYAAVQIKTTTASNADMPTYVVVAIHAKLPTK